MKHILNVVQLLGLVILIFLLSFNELTGQVHPPKNYRKNAIDRSNTSRAHNDTRKYEKKCTKKVNASNRHTKRRDAAVTSTSNHESRVKHSSYNKKIAWLVSAIKSYSEYEGHFFTDSFDAGMVGKESEEKEYNRFLNKTPDKREFTLLTRQYEQFAARIDEQYTQDVRIPKIIHQIWIGPHPFPRDAVVWQQSWIDAHPDWLYKLWTNKDVEQFEFANKVYFDEATNWGEKADILRYEILYRFGGLYVDIDERCVEPFDLLHHTCDFYAGIHALPLMTIHLDALRINNAVIGARPGHPILEAAVKNIKKNRKHKQLLSRTGPDYFTKIILKELKHSQGARNDIIFPANFFYPYGSRTGKGFSIKPGGKIMEQLETMAVHYYTGYWVKPPKK